VNGFWNARFLLYVSNIHFKYPLWAISVLEVKDVHLMGQHCPIHPLQLNKLHAAEHLLHSSSVPKNFVFQDKKSGRNLQIIWRKKLALFPP